MYLHLNGAGDLGLFRTFDIHSGLSSVLGGGEMMKWEIKHSSLGIKSPAANLYMKICLFTFGNYSL